MKVNTNINHSFENHCYSSTLNALQQVMDNNPVANFICSGDGAISFANKAAASLFGYSVQELLTKNIDELFKTSILSAQLNKEEFHTLYAKRKQGTQFYSEIFLNYFEDEGLTKINLLVMDASAKADRQAAELNFSLFLENSEEFLLLVNKEYKVVLFNHFMASGIKARFGVDLEKGMDVFLMVTPDEKEMIKSYYDRCFLGETISFDTVLKGDGGKLSYFRSVFKPARNKEGVVIAAIAVSRNITSQVETQHRITESEQRWSFALESSGQGLWDWNIASGETFFSPGWKKMLGFEENEIAAHISEWESRLHPEDKEKMQAHIEAHLSIDNPYYESEYRLKAKDGSYKWILARGMIISRNANGKPLHMIGTHTDITERKRIEGDYKLLFYNNPLPMWTYDRQTLKFITVNNAAIEHYGYSREEFSKMTILDIRPEEDIEKTLDAVNLREQRNITSKQVWRHKKKNGEIIFVNISGYTFGEENTRQTLILSEDVTEKVHAENRLKDSERQYRTLFKNNPLPSYIYDTDTLTFIEVNDAAIKHYGYSHEEFSKMSLLDLHPPDIHQSLKQFIKRANKTEKEKANNWRQVKKSGEQIIVDSFSNKIDYNGIRARLVVISDVTEKVKAEREVIEVNQRYRYVTEATSDIIWDWDFANDKVLWSDNYEKKFGWQLPTDKKTTIENLKQIVHKEDLDRVLHSLNQALNDDHVNKWEEEFRVLKANNSYAYIKDTGLILRDEKGTAYRMIGAIQDITEQKAKEKALLDSNERFQLAAKATSEVLWETDFENKATYLSPTYKEVFGFTEDEKTFYKTWPQYIHPDEREAVLKGLDKFLKDPSQTQYQQECRHLKGDGSYLHIVNHVLVLRDNSGKPLKLVGAIQDISMRKKAEQEILKTKERFEFAANATSDIIWELDLKTQLFYISDNYSKIMGWKEDEGNYPDFNSQVALVHPEDREGVVQRLMTCIADPTKEIWEEEFRFQRANGSYAFVVDRGFIIRNENGEAERIIGAMEEISERRSEEELQSLELRVYEVSAVPGIHFHNVLKTFISGYENLSPGVHASVTLLGQNDELEILAPQLTKEHARQLRYFIERQKNKLANPQAERNLIISAVDSDDWRYTPDTPYKWKTSWTVPVYNHNGDLLAFMTLFLDQDLLPSELETNTLVRLKNLLRILIVNHLSLEQIRVFTERYNNVLKATHDMVWDWNLETGIFYRNPEGVKKVYGIEDGESIENVYSWMERIHPGDHIKVQHVINNILHAKEENTFDVEYRFKRDDDSYSYIYDRGIIVRNKEGKPLRMIGAAQDVTDRKKLEHELLQKELDRQKSISQATIDTQEEERREIGKELHDNVNQVLTTTKLYLDLSLSSPELKDELIKKSSKNIIYVINEIRQLSRSLMDPSIGDLGLIDSINDLVDNINITRKLHVSLSANSELEKLLAENQKLTVFRIIQEAMNNTLKYAQATTVNIRIRQVGEEAELQIVDDGKGFNPETVKKGAGLKNIQNRVYLTNGRLTIDSAPGKGCKIVINFPINNNLKSN